jgi:ankyrin repeat protein
MPALLLSPGESEKRFHQAAERGHVGDVQRLYELHGRSIVHGVAKESWTALHYASYNGHLEVVKYLVETCGANVHAARTSGNTSLHDASLRNNLKIVQYLAEHCNADVHAVDVYGHTPLHLASNGSGCCRHSCCGYARQNIAALCSFE